MMNKVIECLQKYYGRTEEEWQAKLSGIEIKDEEKMIHDINFVRSQWFPYSSNSMGERESLIFEFSIQRDIQSELAYPPESYLLAIFAENLKYFEELPKPELKKIANAVGAFACLIGNYEIARFIFNQVPESSPKTPNRAEALFHCSLFNENVDSAMEWVLELAKTYSTDIRKFPSEFYNDAHFVSDEWSIIFNSIIVQFMENPAQNLNKNLENPSQQEDARKEVKKTQKSPAALLKKFSAIHSAPTTPIAKPDICLRLCKTH